MKRTHGFTLIEVLVAMSIMAVSFSVLFSLSSRSIDGMRRARDMEGRIQFATTKLAEMRLIDQIDVGDKASGSLDDGTTWSIEVLPFIRPVPDGPRRNLNSVVRIQVSMEWQGRNEPQRWSFDSYRLVHATVGLRVPLEEKLLAIAK
jgi:prepilin-type N-terminal cleavage/methylation domain-containing protein